MTHFIPNKYKPAAAWLVLIAGTFFVIRAIKPAPVAPAPQ